MQREKNTGLEIDRDSLWKTYEFIRACGQVHEARNFAVNIMDTLQQICPYDQGRIYFYNKNGNICDQHLVNIDPKLVNLYHVYYSMLDNGRYSIPLRRKDSGFWDDNSIPEYEPDIHDRFISSFHVPLTDQKLWVIDWSLAPRDEFVKDYVRYIHLNFSTGFAIYDIDDSLRIVFMLDRTSHFPYSKEELVPLVLAIPMLEHLYQNLTVRSYSAENSFTESYASLTKREREITDMLCQGMSSRNICEMLKISSATLYTHNAHIFKKMGVSSRQELVAKIMRTDLN